MDSDMALSTAVGFFSVLQKCVFEINEQSFLSFFSNESFCMQFRTAHRMFKMLSKVLAKRGALVDLV